MTNVSPSQRPDRLAHPGVDLRRTRILQVDVAHRARVLVGDEERRLALEDLEGERHVGGARHARQVALDLRVAGQPLRLVLVLLLASLGQVGNLAADRRRRRLTARRRPRRRRPLPWPAPAPPARDASPAPAGRCALRGPSWRCSGPARSPFRSGLPSAVRGTGGRGAWPETGRAVTAKAAPAAAASSPVIQSLDAVTHCGDLPRHPDARIGAGCCQADERARDAMLGWTGAALTAHSTGGRDEATADMRDRRGAGRYSQ